MNPQSYIPSNFDRVSLLPGVLKSYAKDIDRYGKPIDSGASSALNASSGALADLISLAEELAIACEESYNARDYPSDGTSRQELAAKSFRDWQKSPPPPDELPSRKPLVPL